MSRFNLLSRLAITLLLLVPASSILAEAVWLNKTYNFGLFKEADGPRKGSVKLYNSGPTPITITGARPSCGCTDVEYPQDPIAPGDTVDFFFKYNPLGRPGKFDKTITVYVDGNNSSDTYTLRIKGSVLGTPESLNMLYPYEGGPLRLTQTTLVTNNIPSGESRHFFINGYNQTMDTIQPRISVADPAISVDLSTLNVAPGDIITFSIFLDTKKVGKTGSINIPMTLIPDSRHPDKTVDLKFIGNIISSSQKNKQQ